MRILFDRKSWLAVFSSSFLFVLTMFTSAGGFAQTLTTLYDFGGSSTAPIGLSGVLVLATDDNFYGTSLLGGQDPIYGTIFKMTPSGTVTIVYSFCSDGETTLCVSTGAVPNGLIQANDGNFYGTTRAGGSDGIGTVFRVTSGGTFTVLHSLCASCNEGSYPSTGVVQGSDGNLYGTTSGGTGTVFKITMDGVLTTLYAFCPTGNCIDGVTPKALVEGPDGNFYGTTGYGGQNSNSGTVFKISPSGSFTTIHQFCSLPGCADGGAPTGIVLGSDGELYGTTLDAVNDSSGNLVGIGTVFKITTHGVLTTLHTFCKDSGCPDGNDAEGALLQGSDGNIYGTTRDGGANSGGTVFRITPSGSFLTLYSFCAVPGGVYCLDGFLPIVGLTQGPNGLLYGSTSVGGTNGALVSDEGYGTIFSLSLPTAPPPVVGTTTTLSASPTSAPYGTAISLTSLVKASTGTTTPKGTVKFKYGSTVLGTVTLNSTGQGTLSIKSLPAGSDSVIAVYSGNSSFGASTSNTVKITISAAPIVTLSPKSLAFPATDIGSTSEAQVITLKNSGSTGTLTISSITLGGAQSDDFALSQTCGSSLAAGASCTLTVSFKPVAAGAKSASVSIADNATGSPQLVALSGTGTAATVPTLTVSPTSLSFASTAVGATSAAKAVTLTNSGKSTVTFSSIALSGVQADDFVLSTTCTSTLGIGASCALSVRFKPVAAGSKTASVSIADNGRGSPQTVSLSGTGSSELPAATPVLSPKAGTYSTAQKVSISDATAAATIYYTTNGTTPTTTSTKYTAPIEVSKSETVKAIAVAAGFKESAGASATYTITPVTATPAFSPAGGAYTAAQTVSISDATSGASIYYTTNGSTPTTSSTKYSAALKINSTETLKAIAVATGHLSSDVASAAYTITGEPVTATAVYSFSGNPTGDAYPEVGLVQGDDGNFYGTASGGDYTAGTVFKLTPEGVETVIHSFGSGTDGYAPRAPLMQGSDGNFYGTTFNGGAASYGTVYKISAAGLETVIYNFPDHYIDGTIVDGERPGAALVQDSHGNLYGTTAGGQNGTDFTNGTVFKINLAGLEAWLYVFKGGADGGASGAPLIEGQDGDFYGTTNASQYSNGTVFRITPDGVETVIHTFDTAADGTGKGSIAGLIKADDGNFYGTTENGGAYGAGTVFKITPDGQESVLHSFGSGSDGAYPLASLMQGSDGNLYGTTLYGGAYEPSGTVFKITTEGVETVVYSFTPAGYGYFPNGEQPTSALIQGRDGDLYGTAQFGGAYGLGTVFKLSGVIPAAVNPKARTEKGSASK